MVKERSEVDEIGDGEGAVKKDAAEDETMLCLSNDGGFKFGSVAVRIETRLAIHPVPAAVKISAYELSPSCGTTVDDVAVEENEHDSDRV